MIRKIYNLIPKRLQETLKLIYYNYHIKAFSFSLEKDYYRTSNNEWSVITATPLYFVVKDVVRYERFHKVSEGEVIIDAGANEGILSLIYSRKVKNNGRVFSFEPDMKNIKKFNVNLGLNRNVMNISLREQGLWETNEQIVFYEAGTVGSSVFFQDKNSVERTINGISIDFFVKREKIKKLDFIKMDIEGAEIEALKGARETIKSLKPNFAIASYHKVNGEYTYKQLEVIFTELEYPFNTVFYDDGEIITYAGELVEINST